MSPTPARPSPIAATDSNYGWDADNTANMRIRGSTGSPDFRYDSMALMQKDGVSRKWEIAVPNGMYEIRLVAGDPSFTTRITS